MSPRQIAERGESPVAFDHHPGLVVAVWLSGLGRVIELRGCKPFISRQK